MDEVATFLDGGKLPCLLVENKADLLSYGEIKAKTFEETMHPVNRNSSPLLASFRLSDCNKLIQLFLIELPGCFL